MAPRSLGDSSGCIDFGEPPLHPTTIKPTPVLLPPNNTTKLVPTPNKVTQTPNRAPSVSSSCIDFGPPPIGMPQDASNRYPHITSQRKALGQGAAWTRPSLIINNPRVKEPLTSVKKAMPDEDASKEIDPYTLPRCARKNGKIILPPADPNHPSQRHKNVGTQLSLDENGNVDIYKVPRRKITVSPEEAAKFMEMTTNSLINLERKFEDLSVKKGEGNASKSRKSRFEAVPEGDEDDEYMMSGALGKKSQARVPPASARKIVRKLDTTAQDRIEKWAARSSESVVPVSAPAPPPWPVPLPAFPASQPHGPVNPYANPYANPYPYPYPYAPAYPPPPPVQGVQPLYAYGPGATGQTLLLNILPYPTHTGGQAQLAVPMPQITNANPASEKSNSKSYEDQYRDARERILATDTERKLEEIQKKAEARAVERAIDRSIEDQVSQRVAAELERRSQASKMSSSSAGRTATKAGSHRSSQKAPSIPGAWPDTGGFSAALLETGSKGKAGSTSGFQPETLEKSSKKGGSVSGFQPETLEKPKSKAGSTTGFQPETLQSTNKKTASTGGFQPETLEKNTKGSKDGSKNGSDRSKAKSKSRFDPNSVPAWENEAAKRDSEKGSNGSRGGSQKDRGSVAGSQRSEGSKKSGSGFAFDAGMFQEAPGGGW